MKASTVFLSSTILATAIAQSAAVPIVRDSAGTPAAVQLIKRADVGQEDHKLLPRMDPWKMRPSETLNLLDNVGKDSSSSSSTSEPPHLSGVLQGTWTHDWPATERLLQDIGTEHAERLRQSLQSNIRGASWADKDKKALAAEIYIIGERKHEEADVKIMGKIQLPNQGFPPDVLNKAKGNINRRWNTAHGIR